jgi:hypothetical protein
MYWDYYQHVNSEDIALKLQCIEIIINLLIAAVGDVRCFALATILAKSGRWQDIVTVLIITVYFISVGGEMR